MLISVIIPCYNGEKYLKKCVNNIINQTYKNTEIIIVDDLSSDNSKNVMEELKKEFKDKIKPVYSKQNNGPGGAKNEGLKIAKGKYIMFMDCDDYLDNNYIENLATEAKKNSSIDIFITGFKKVEESGKILYTRRFKREKKVLWQAIPSWGKLYKKEWLYKNNLSMPYGKVFEDIMFQAAQILCKPKFKYVNIVGYNYVYNQNSISHTTLCYFKKGSIEKEQDYLKDLKKYIKTSEDEEILTYFAYRTMIWHLLKSGCYVGKEAMLKEYEKAFSFLECEFPDFKNNKFVSLFRKCNDRKIIKLTLWFIRFLYNIHLSKLFFSIYGRIDLRKLWPSM